jgi:glycine dehydrogenase subunit 1
MQEAAQKGVRDATPARSEEEAQEIIGSLIPNVRHTGKMLEELGMASLDELFSDIPQKVRIDGLDLPGPTSEQEVLGLHARLAGRNQGPLSGDGMPVFLGLGLKERYVPAPVRALVLRSEFYTSYTPYQPEASQGMLQALFEFQSIVSELTGLPVANVSQYDWATAAGEAAVMAVRSHEGSRFLIPEALTPAKRSVIMNYLKGSGVKVESVPFDPDAGTLDMAALESMLGPDVTGLYVETPNLFGLWEPEAHRLKPMLEDKGAGLLVVGADPLSLALAKGPGEYGADVVVGELGGYGTSPSFGGPLVGMLAASNEMVRKVPGRIVGVTRDGAGKHAFTLTLQTREQHIRRERAMSNICTNQTLGALAASVWFSLMGGAGMARLAEQNATRASTLRKRLAEIPGVDPLFEGAVFEEFAMRFDREYSSVHKGLLERGVHGGADLGRVVDSFSHAGLFATTEVHSDTDHDRLLEAMREVVS